MSSVLKNLKASPILKLLFCSAALLSSPLVQGAATSSAGLTYQGVLTDSTDTPITGTVSVTFKIYDSAKTCLLWSELQSITPDSKGRFSVALGLGTHTDVAGNSFVNIFSSGAAINCDPSGTYTPAAGEDRMLTIVVGSTVLTPSVAIKAVPFAFQANQISGKGLANLAQISGVGSGNSFTPEQFDFLIGLAAPAATAVSATPCVSNDGLKYVGGVWTCVTLSGGGGSSTTSGLLGATANNTIDNANFAQTWNWSTASSQTPLALSANALTNGSVLSVSSSSNSLNSTNGLLNVANTGSSNLGTVARIQSNNTAGSGITVLANGNVGIGTTNPGAPLEIANNSTAGGTTAAYGSKTILTLNPISTNAMSNYGAYSGITFTGTNGANNIAGSFGSAGLLLNNGSGTIGKGIGVSGYIGGNSGAITNANALQGMVNSSGGTIINAHAGDFNITNTGGTIFSGIGVYVGTIEATSKWSIYSADATAPSYLAGNVGIGIGATNPAARLEVAGQIVSKEYVVPSGNNADFAKGNSIVMQSIGSSSITLSNMVAGGVYNIVVEDLTPTTYTFSGCSPSYFSPANGVTTNRTVYTIYRRGSSTCYITWSSGFN
jgi:hypothetical protein